MILVSALVVGRRNAVGEESTCATTPAAPLLKATLTEPGELPLGDDRRTLPGVSPIWPLDPRAPAQRDVLVVTLASRWP